MNEYLLYALAAVLLFSAGLWGFLFQVHLVRKLLALNITGAGIFLLLIAIAYRNRDPDPDPVPHAMVITGIVVAISTTALGLAIVRRIHNETGSATLPEDAGRE